MLVVLPFSERDATQAIRLAEWIEQLGGCSQYSCLLVRDARVGHDTVSRILNPLQRAFGSVHRIDYPNDGVNAWPFSCNRMFNRAAKFIELEQPQPFLWLEPDAVPMGAGWLDAIAAEYAAAMADGKLFLGDKVEVENVPLHLSGIAVYPATMSHHAGEALMAQDTAWDVFAAHQIVPKAAWSELILHAWKHPRFESADQIQREIFDFKSKCVLFHADKSGSLIDLLRKNLSGASSTTQCGASSTTQCGASHRVVELDGKRPTRRMAEEAGEAQPAQNPICDILIKSYPADYEWLRYCLQSIDKFGSGFRKIVIVIPKDANNPTGPDCSLEFLAQTKVIHVVENGDGYLFQQAVKASAHEFTDADYILHVDSDCIFQRPFSPADFFHDGKPVWYVTPYEAVAVPWRAPTEKFIGERVQFEFMRRLPQLVPRALHLAVAAFCLARHKVRLTDYILSQPDRAFSEFNALGALAWLRDRGDFHWVDTTTVEMPPVFAKQYRSYDGITDETRAEIENVLKGGDPLCAQTTSGTWTGKSNSQGQLSQSESDIPAKMRSASSAAPTFEPDSAAIRQTKEGWWIIDGDTHISKWVEEEGRLDHDRWLLDQILPLIPEGGVVVDGGAFIGDHTIAYVERVGPTDKVYAFEPTPIAFECLERNISRVLPFYGHLYNLGLSDQPENVAMLHDCNVGASSIAETVPDSDIHTDTLDNILLGGHRMDRCDFIKLDVEGFEVRALQGAEKIIAQFKPLLLIEVNTGALVRQGTSPQELFKWLEDHGYSHTPVQQLQIVDPPQYDVLCRPAVVGSANGCVNIVQPWRSKPESLDEIMLHALRLKEFCTAPSYTRQVREKLREAGVIK